MEGGGLSGVRVSVRRRGLSGVRGAEWSEGK